MASARYIFSGLLTMFVSAFALLVIYFSLTPAWNLFANLGLTQFGNLGQMPILIQHLNLIWFSGFTFMFIGLVILAYGLTFREEPAEYNFGGF